MSLNILLADDDDSIRLVLNKALSRAGHKVRATDNALTLQKWVEAGEGEVVLTDVLMGDHEVFDFLPEMRRARPDLPIIIISANNTVNTAMKSGEHNVFEYVPKPFDLNEVVSAVERAGATLSSGSGVRRVKSSAALPMVGRSAAMQPVFRAVSRYASGNLPVLIQGDVGTGKDLVARLLHEGGSRKDKPFIRMTQFDSVSMTLQKVNGGDIYVDEVAELAAVEQEGLLAVMIESEYIPLKDRPRILSATRKNLRKLAADGKFRDDLLYRLNVAEIRIPLLSDRDQDIYEFAEVFLGNADITRGQSRRFSSEALDILHRHNWSGNVRELENVVRRLALLYSDDVITADMVRQEFSRDIAAVQTPEDAEKLAGLLNEAAQRLLNAPIDPSTTPYQSALGWVEKPLIEEALRITGGNRAKASELLGIHRNTLRTKLKALNID